MLREIVFDKNESSIFLITGIDKLLSGISPKNNIFLRFNFFKSEGGASWGSPEDSASIIYFRIAYLMYPRKVFTGEKGIKIVRGSEFLNSAFNLSEDWLRENNICGILTFSRSEKGEISWTYEKIGAK